MTDHDDDDDSESGGVNLFVLLRELACCTHPPPRCLLVSRTAGAAPTLSVCLDCGATKNGLEREWVLPKRVAQLVVQPTIATLCQLGDEAFGRVLAGTEEMANRMHTTENAAAFAWAASQAGIKK